MSLGRMEVGRHVGERRGKEKEIRERRERESERERSRRGAGGERKRTRPPCQPIPGGPLYLRGP